MDREKSAADGSDRLEPDDGRRDHGADRDRRRLPRLQREHGAPVRADVPDLGTGPERERAGAGQRGPDRRSPRGVGGGRGPGSARGRLDHRDARPEARRRGSRAARGLDRDRPRPLGPGPQVRGDQPGQLERGRPRGRDHAARPRQAGAGRDRPGAEHLQRADAAGDSAQPGRVRERDRRPWPGPQRSDREASARTGAPAARRARPRRSGHAARPLLHRAPRHSRGGGAGGGDAGADVRGPEHDLRSARERGAAVHPGDDLTHAPDLRHGDPHHAPDAALPAQHRGAVHRPGAGSASAAQDGARHRRRGDRRRAGAARGARLQPTAPADGGVAAALQRRRCGADRHRRPHHVLQRAEPDAAVHHAGAVGVLLRLAAVQQPRRRREPRQRPRKLAAVHRAVGRRRPDRTEQRGGTVLRGRERRRRQPGQLPPRQPVPEYGVAGPDAGMRGGTRALCPGPGRDRKPARRPGTDAGVDHEAGQGRRGCGVMARERQTTPIGAEKAYDERLYRRGPRGLSRTAVGAVMVALIVIGTYLAFAKEVPFTVDDEGLPLHTDATIEIRPRLFLEGNFFLDTSPGSPSAPELPDGGTIPVTQTATAVQLDQVLTSLQKPERENLSEFLEGFGAGLNRQPTAEEDETQDPAVQGESGAQAINDSFRYGGAAGRDSAIVNEALLGTQPHDLSKLIAANRRVFGALLSREEQLKDLITNFNTTTGALAAESENLSATVRELAPTLEQGEPSLRHLSESLPPLRTFARALEPSIAELPGTIDASGPWLRQTRKLLRERELGGLAKILREAQPKLASATRTGIGLLRENGLVARCGSEVLVPTGNTVIDDAGGAYPFSTGQRTYREFFYTAAQQAGAGSSFDGNGSFLRIQPGGGDVLTSTNNPDPQNPVSNGTLFSPTIAPPLGTRPNLPASPKPPFETGRACHENPVPDLNGTNGGPGTI